MIATFGAGGSTLKATVRVFHRQRLHRGDGGGVGGGDGGGGDDDDDGDDQEAVE